MYAFKIQGGYQLKGEVEINGAKNAILPIMIAALLTKEPLELSNISYLSDVNTLSDLLKSMGMKIKSKKNSLILTILPGVFKSPIYSRGISTKLISLAIEANIPGYS